MLKFSNKLSSAMSLMDSHVWKKTREMAIHQCSGHFSKVSAFYESLYKRGGFIAPGVVLTWGEANRSAIGANLVFVGEEADILAAIQKIQAKKRASSSTLVKMAVVRMINVMDGIDNYNKGATADLRMGPLISPGLVPGDLPLLKRFLCNEYQDGTRKWHWRGSGSSVIELRRFLARPDVTEEVIEQAWKLVSVHRVMHA